MMTETRHDTVDLPSLTPLDRRAAVELGRIEYRRLAEALAGLDDGEWQRPTDCEGWSVRDMAGHLLGSMATVSSLRSVVREQRAVAARAARTGEAQVDAMTALQIVAMADLTSSEVADRIAATADAAADGRRRVPRPLARLVRFRVVMGSIDETWRLEYLLGTILTRDTWLHRVSDLARAVDRAPALDAGHDARIVADVAAEWARRHGRPVELSLTGPAGGHFTAGRDGPSIELDAVEFCRILSGRAEPTHPLLETFVPF
ncbi:MAG: maleylpyruvate isomerase family mycothiol-dependent enzyme [Ilumatobacteraceae bacterium]